jgi:2-isopropylmalate synthase
MGTNTKIEFFKKLVAMGFKEIEIGLPGASAAEEQFCRRLISEGHIPNDVTVQVLVQARDDLIRKTFAALEGAQNVVVHLYNSTSPQQRDVVFQKSKDEIVALAVQNVNLIRELSKQFKGNVTLEYSPESFSQTEPFFAVRICNEVIAAWETSKDRQIIINLPSTVEVHDADQFIALIGFMHERLNCREHVCLSLHPHNDRGQSVAVAQMGMRSGYVDRLEGTCFGNGERAGNLDLLVVAANLLRSNIDPTLDMKKAMQLAEFYCKATGLSIDPRHPYFGAFVFKAFSGTHQDAIRKAISSMRVKYDLPVEWKVEQVFDYISTRGLEFEVAYLILNPADLGRGHETIIEISNLSGSSGIAYLMQQEFGIDLPKDLQRDFGAVVKGFTDHRIARAEPSEIHDLFCTTYMPKAGPIKLVSYDPGPARAETTLHQCRFTFEVCGQTCDCVAEGSGLIAALLNAINTQTGVIMDVKDYEEKQQHCPGREASADAKAVSFVKVVSQHGGEELWGVGLETSTELSAMQATIAAVNRHLIIQQWNRQIE